MPEETLCQEVRVRVASLATSHQNKYSDVSGSVSGMFAGLSLLVCFLYVLDRKLQIDQDATTWKIQGELQRFERGEFGTSKHGELRNVEVCLIYLGYHI
jgi:hypothetical protein